MHKHKLRQILLTLIIVFALLAVIFVFFIV